MVGDTPEIDVVGARAAELRTLLVASGNHEHGADTANADWVIDSIADLPRWYAEVLERESQAPL
jgi:ribonucleotide monophosphatase NagD (HAD superfamily)